MTDRLIVCRCEDVTAEDVRRAVRAGHHDVESIKRFTGFGTGICQGVHCLRLALAVAREALRERDPEAAERLRPFTPRPPLRPLPLSWLAALPPGEEEEPAPGAPQSEEEGSG